MHSMQEKSWRSPMLGGAKCLLWMWQARPQIYECLARNPQPAPRPQRQGRVFTMDAIEVEKFKDLIQGTCEVNGKVLTVLFDSGAHTLSFLVIVC